VLDEGQEVEREGIGRGGWREGEGGSIWEGGTNRKDKMKMGWRQWMGGRSDEGGW
jgi:hypothetical protein